jgi:hypothetical protein
MVIQLTRQGLLEEAIDTGEKGGEGLAGTSRRGNQRIGPLLNGRPSLSLDGSRGANARTKPLSDERMKAGQRHRDIRACRERMLYSENHCASTGSIMCVKSAIA